MKSNLKFGSTIDFVDVIRADGSCERVCGKVQNFVSNGWCLSPFRLHPSVATWNISTFSTRASQAPAGNFSQAGTTITRDSGSFDLTTVPIGASIEFADGTKAYATGVGTASSKPVSRSQSASSQAITVYNTHTAGNDGTNREQNSSWGVAGTPSYLNGVLTYTRPSFSFTPAVAGYTLRRIHVYEQNAGAGFIYDLPVDVVVNIGDAVVVGSFTYTATWDDHEPRVFAVSPMAGYVGTGITQRILRAHGSTGRYENSNNPNRIWLIDDGSEYAISDMPVADVAPGALTVLETITATGSNTAPTINNNFTASNSCFGSVVTGGATIKQIAWGDTSNVFGIIEFDTPVNIPAAKVITIGASLQTDVQF